MAQVPGIHGTVPDGQEQEDGELSSEKLSWYRVSDHMITYFVHWTFNEYVL